MTREEAIQVLNMVEAHGLADEAKRMAIEALSEPNMIPIKLEKRYPHSRDEDITDALMRGYQSAQAELVRCKDCIYYEKYDTWSACTYWSGNPYEQASVIDDDFCSYGERSEK